MSPEEKTLCFCTLALGNKYRLLAKQLAGDLQKYSPGNPLVVGTDEPKDFSGFSNVIAFLHRKQGILHCYHDKRFVIEKALSMFAVAIHVDADTKILASLPTQFSWSPGITGYHKNLIEHVNKACPERLDHLKNVAAKLNISIENAQFIGESIYVVAREGGKEKEFLQQWGLIGRYLELKGIHAGDGNAMGLAASKVGLTISNQGWDNLRKVTKNLDASYKANSHLFPKEQESFWSPLTRKLNYHYRLNRARIMALKDFDFYYR